MNNCKHADRSPVYRLCAVMLLVNYIQICLPCIIAVTMIPVFCFCMPCLIRILARLHGGNLGLVSLSLSLAWLSFATVMMNDDDVCHINTSGPSALFDHPT